MITWIQIWPLMGLPAFVIAALCALPTVEAFHRVLGGGPLREALVNFLVVPWLPGNHAQAFIELYAGLSALQEWLISLWLALNVNALLLPLLYLAGCGVIRLANWFATTDLRLKREQAKR